MAVAASHTPLNLFLENGDSVLAVGNGNRQSVFQKLISLYRCLLFLHLVQIGHWEFIILELVLELFLELIEYLIVQLGKEHVFARGDCLRGRHKTDVDSHDVSQLSKSALIPELLLSLLMLICVDFEPVFQSDHAAVTVFEDFVDVLSINKSISKRLHKSLTQFKFLPWMGNDIFFVLLVALRGDLEVVGNVDSIGVVVLAEAETSRRR